MKKTSLLKTMLLLCALIVGSSSAWAADITVTKNMSDIATANNWTTSSGSDVYPYTSFSLDDVITVSTNSNNNNGSYWSDGWRLYQSYSGVVTLTAATNYELKSVTFTYGKSNNGVLLGPGTSTTQQSSGTAITITGNTASFTVGKTKTGTANGQVKITAISVTYTSTATDPSSDVAFANTTPSIDFSKTTTYSQTATTADGYTGTVTYEITANTAGATLEGSTITVTQEGTVTVKATAPATTGWAKSEASYTLTVTDSRVEAGIAWSSTDEVRIAKGASESDYTLPTLTNPHNLPVSYSSTNENIAVEVEGEILVATDVLGSTTITASFAGDDDYKAASTSFTITVYDPNAKGTINNPYSVEEVIALNPTSTSTPAEGQGEVYVIGFIVGGFNSNNKFTTTVSEYQNSNFAIASSVDETDKIVPIQVSSDFQTSFGLKNKSYNAGVAKVLIKGDLLKYFSRAGVKNVDEITKVAEQVNITSAGMATYYTDCALDFTDFDDMMAYTATVENNAITFNRVRKVPANTGILLRNPSKAAASHLVPVAENPESVTSQFVGTLDGISSLASVDGDYMNYILNNGSQGIGFYKANGQSLGVHKAYLHVNASAARSFIGFNFEEGSTTAIDVRSKMEDVSGEVYNLNGQRVAQPTKGLYIVNGKKVIMK